MKVSFSLIGLLLLTLTTTVGADVKADRAYLLDGVEAIAAPGGRCGPICVFGEDAFALCVGASGRTAREAVAAAGRLGEGKVVLLGHPNFFGKDAFETADTGRFLVNAVRWAAGEKPKGEPKVAVYRQPGLSTAFRDEDINALDAAGDQWVRQIAGADVLCLNPSNLENEKEVAAVRKFVEKGGGLVAVELGWGWLYMHPGKRLDRDHPGNRIVAPAGLVWASGSLRPTGEKGFVPVDEDSNLIHAATALDALLAHAEGEEPLEEAELDQAGNVISHAARSLPESDGLLRPKLEKLMAEYGERPIVPTEAEPLTQDQAIERLVMTLQMHEMLDKPARQIEAHPAAESFPGKVPDDAERVSKTVTIDTSVPKWHSTGLYAAPGERITVRVPGKADDAGLKVRIGCHSDTVWHREKWLRAPDITRVFDIDRSTTPAANAFGGLVYIVVPEDCDLGEIPVKITGTVEAPHFVLGETDPQEWRETIRHRPAPWGEVETSKVVIAVPSEELRKLDEPVKLMRFWNRFMDCCADLAAWDRNREFPQRYVCDVQISAGYMHSGYPIMTQMNESDVMANTEAMTTFGDDGIWGLFHEMGHNHQSRDWTFRGTVEVTVNLFVLYAFDELYGIDAIDYRRFTPEKRKEIFTEYFSQEPSFDRWRARVWLALMMYIQLEEEFGWQPFKEVFAEYRDLPLDEKPRTEMQKRSQWMVRFSRAVGKNLGPFFDAYGVTVSDEAKAEVADLPTWMPENFPPKVDKKS